MLAGSRSDAASGRDDIFMHVPQWYIWIGNLRHLMSSFDRGHTLINFSMQLIQLEQICRIQISFGWHRKCNWQII